jgi:hypothetical protein
MGVGNSRLALYAPLLSNPLLSGTGGSSSLLTQAVSGTAGWWDASSTAGLLGAANTPTTVWNSPTNALVDLSGNNQDLVPFCSPSSSGLPPGSPHLSGLPGGVGYPVSEAGLLQPALDPHSGWQLEGSAPSATSSWSWYLVWSRPNWRQGINLDTNPITLLSFGTQAILQVDSLGGANRLVLFPGAGQIVVNSSMARRHTHSLVIRYSPTSGTDLWLDDTKVVGSVPWSPGTLSGPILLLHDSTPFGGAQCWFHEAAVWNRVLSDAEIAAVVSYAGRWVRGARKGLYLIINGQSNAINYSMNDGAAALLARGIAWYLALQL